MKLEELYNHTEGDFLKDQFGNVYRISVIDKTDFRLPLQVQVVRISDEFEDLDIKWHIKDDHFDDEAIEAGRTSWIWVTREVAAKGNKYTPEKIANIIALDTLLPYTPTNAEEFKGIDTATDSDRVPSFGEFLASLLGEAVVDNSLKGGIDESDDEDESDEDKSDENIVPLSLVSTVLMQAVKDLRKHGFEVELKIKSVEI